MCEHSTQVLVAGAGVGGVAAALAALEGGASVILTEECDWIGGQLTSQAVPPDENWAIETTGCTAAYREFRRRVRDVYRRTYPLLPEHRDNPLFDPGNALVSHIAHEPRVSLAVLTELLTPWISRGRLQVCTQWEPIAAHTDGDVVTSATFRDAASDEHEVSAAIVLDATEEGVLLELAGVEHVIGTESASQTGEMHAPAEADSLDQQAITWCFALGHDEGADHTIERPAQYDYWRDFQADFWPAKQLSWNDLDPETLEPRHKA
ncbi:MAG TPA: FAD-dependent oxidoreductase, partial [Propionibacteriaceae bacterium]|nr:FAD-dependent oxidoreductase [Propionibacteriaceae bacterium]